MSPSSSESQCILSPSTIKHHLFQKKKYNHENTRSLSSTRTPFCLIIIFWFVSASIPLLNLFSLPSSCKVLPCQPCVQFKEKWEMSLEWRPSASSFFSLLIKGQISQARQIWHETDPSWIRDHDQSDSHTRQANRLTARSHTHVPYFSHDPLIRENMITHTSEFPTPPEEGGNQKCPGMDGAAVEVEWGICERHSKQAVCRVMERI